MGLKETIMETMMGKMSQEEKEEMMSKMMEMFFGRMSSEEKQKMMENMMEKFMSGVSEEEKAKMFQNMRTKMMQNMMGGSGMMSSMKKGMGENPMDMCKKMMGGMERFMELSVYSTPELHNLFEEWISKIEEEIAAKLKENGKVDSESLSKEFKLSKESIDFILLRMAKHRNIKLKAEIQ